jgi:hypothetical protein
VWTAKRAAGPTDLKGGVALSPRSAFGYHAAKGVREIGRGRRLVLEDEREA